LQINTDRELLSKVLCHLLDNAIKFTKQGSVTYGFKAKGDDLEFYVKDTGVGINRDVQGKIFEKFMQENVSDTRGHEGSGLGLSIVHGILELLGGHIWLESFQGKGSAFFFTIPVGLLANEKSLDYRNSVQKTLKPLILIADDETSSSQFVQQILNKEGIDSIIVSNGKQAVEACHQNQMISMVLMDLKMPVMDGFESTKRIKSFCPHLIVIAVTAYALSGDEKRALEAGCDDYIAKPFEREMLLKKLRKYGTTGN
jgi:CheY-like chemotaxis protein